MTLKMNELFRKAYGVTFVKNLVASSLPFPISWQAQEIKRNKTIESSDPTAIILSTKPTAMTCQRLV